LIEIAPLRLARKYHPDINPGDHAAEARFREITLAYETLSDPERRGRYDTGAMSSVSGAVSFEFEGFDFSGSTSHSDPTTFGDLFADVFTRRGDPRVGGPEAGADLHATVSLGFDEALRWSQRHVTLTRCDICRSCRGSGVLNVAEARRAVRGGRCGPTSRQHGVLEKLRGVRRSWPTGAE
jgi:molecular chaperone DnaJ